MKRKKMVDVREINLKRQREWEYAQTNYSEAGWLMANFQTIVLNKEVLVKSIFKDWYGDQLEFQIGVDGNREIFLHDNGRYLSWLEENHMDIYPEVKQQFFTTYSIQVRVEYGFILQRTGCKSRELPHFIIQMQQYCLALTALVKIVIEVEQASKLKIDER